MRAVLPLLIVCLASSGCFVIDEINAGQEILEAHAPTSAKEPEEPEPTVTASRPGVQGPGYGERLSEWWRNLREEAPTPPDPKDRAVRCELGGSVVFVRSSDCVLRGGRPT